MRHAHWAFCILLIASTMSNSAWATLVDWSTEAWSPGSLSNSFDVDPGSPGSDVTVAVSGDTGQLQVSLGAGNPQTPAITTALAGGFSPAHPALELAIDLTNNTQGITITINFSNLYAGGVANVSFKIFDIDFANGGGSTFQDQIRNITATSTTGATIAPTISGLGSAVTLSGSGANQVLTGNATSVDTGPGSDNGNATITFNATDIRSITFTYGGGSLFADPTYEHISIDNIDYSVVPEINPASLSVIFCVGLIIWTTFGRPACREPRARRNLWPRFTEPNVLSTSRHSTASCNEIDRASDSDVLAKIPSCLV
jgi:hypothetical protein